MESGTEMMLTLIARTRAAKPDAVPCQTPRNRRSRWSRGEPRPKVTLAQRRKLGVKAADYSAFLCYCPPQHSTLVESKRIEEIPGGNK